MNTSVTNALFKFYAHSKNKEEAEKLIEYIDTLVGVKSKQIMEDYITKDYLRAEVNTIRLEVNTLRAELNTLRAELNTLRADVQADLSDLSEKLTSQFNGMMMKTIFAVLIPIILLILGLYAKL